MLAVAGQQNPPPMANRFQALELMAMEHGYGQISPLAVERPIVPTSEASPWWGPLPELQGQAWDHGNYVRILLVYAAFVCLSPNTDREF